MIINQHHHHNIVSLFIFSIVFTPLSCLQGGYRHRNHATPRGQPEEAVREGAPRAGGDQEGPHRAQAAARRSSVSGIPTFPNVPRFIVSRESIYSKLDDV